jgi:hypothetical protein
MDKPNQSSLSNSQIIVHDQQRATAKCCEQLNSNVNTENQSRFEQNFHAACDIKKVKYYNVNNIIYTLMTQKDDNMTK